MISGDQSRVTRILRGEDRCNYLGGQKEWTCPHDGKGLPGGFSKGPASDRLVPRGAVGDGGHAACGYRSAVEGD
jgi:hypothetical protein